MKKITLSIPKPCHENWDQMTSADKGRFCASCQKTVMDFTDMSDRQLAEFFKKPVGSVCGRFYQDQLNRNIELPRKRIPWVRYFFQFTWPMFVLILKSCGTKENMKGKVKVDLNAFNSSPKFQTATVGTVMTDQVVSIDSIPRETAVNTPAVESNTEKFAVVKKVSNVVKGDDTVGSLIHLDSFKTDLNKDLPMIPQAKVPQALENYTISGQLGGVVVCVRSYPDPVKKIKRIIDTAFRKFSVYPNPVRRNSSVRINFKKLDAGAYVISILNMAGEVIQTKEVVIENKNPLLELPIKETAAGTYFIHAFNRKTGASYSEKIIVQ
jgi:hypothetical protein